MREKKISLQIWRGWDFCWRVREENKWRFLNLLWEKLGEKAAKYMERERGRRERKEIWLVEEWRLTMSVGGELYRWRPVLGRLSPTLCVCVCFSQHKIGLAFFFLSFFFWFLFSFFLMRQTTKWCINSLSKHHNLNDVSIK